MFVKGVEVENYFKILYFLALFGYGTSHDFKFRALFLKNAIVILYVPKSKFPNQKFIASFFKKERNDFLLCVDMPLSHRIVKLSDNHILCMTIFCFNKHDFIPALKTRIYFSLNALHCDVFIKICVKAKWRRVFSASYA